MKKLLIVAVAASAFVAGAEVVEGSNEIGTLAITSSLKNTVVAVPFGDMGSAADVKPADLVLTKGLSADDQLYVFKDGSYQGWVLSEGAWTPLGNASIGSDGLPRSSAGDSSTTLATGSGFWLIRASEPSEAFTFYVCGGYAPSVVSTIKAGAQNLIANPRSTAATPTFTGTPTVGDTILVPQAGVFPLRYTYKSAGWKPALQSFPAGQGAWYISKGSSDITCSWE